MLKRFVARLLIITQIYSNLFQGMVHAATLVDESHHHRHIFEKPDDLGDDESILPTASSGVEDEHISSFTHLYSEINQRGELQFALGDGSFKEPRVFTIPPLERQTDILEYGGVTVKAQSTSFRFQGLRVSINRAGVMVVEGCQTDHHNPIFLASNRPIILNSIEASGLSIAAPRIVHSGISTIAQLKFEGMGTAEGDAFFVNAGQLTAKELFLNHLNSVNGGGINATRFAVDGKLSSTGTIASSELILEENALLKLTDASRADIKTLFLSQASHLENHATTHTASIGVLDGLGGSLTNHGSLMIAEVAADSAFQAITNSHFLDIALGTIQTKQFENHGTFMAAESSLQVTIGKNHSALKAKQLVVTSEFANEDSSRLAIEAMTGDGHFHNLGTIETDTALAIGVKQFTTQGHLKAKLIRGLDTLISFTNLEAGKVDVLEALGFAPTTQVINKGELAAQTMALVSDHTLHSGVLTAQTLTLTGVAAFANHGTMSVEHLDATTLLLNHGELNTQQSTKFAQGLRVEGKATAQLKGLRVTGGEVTNLGKLQVVGVAPAQDLAIKLFNTGTATIDASYALPTSSSALISANDPELMDLTLEQMRSIGSYYKNLLEDTSIDQALLNLEIPISGHPIMRATRNLAQARGLTNQALRLRDLLMGRPEGRAAHSVVGAPIEGLEGGEVIPMQISRGEAAFQRISTSQHVPSIKHQVDLIKEAYEKLTETIGPTTSDAAFEEALRRISGSEHVGIIQKQVEVLRTALAAKATSVRGTPLPIEEILSAQNPYPLLSSVVSLGHMDAKKAASQALKALQSGTSVASQNPFPLHPAVVSLGHMDAKKMASQALKAFEFEVHPSLRVPVQQMNLAQARSAYELLYGAETATEKTLSTLRHQLIEPLRRLGLGSPDPSMPIAIPSQISTHAYFQKPLEMMYLGDLRHAYDVIHGFQKSDGKSEVELRSTLTPLLSWIQSQRVPPTVARTIEALSIGIDHPELKASRSPAEARDLGNRTLYAIDRILFAYKQRALTILRATTLQGLEEQLRQATRQELSPQALLEKTDQLRAVAERYQVLDTHFKPERDLIEMGMGGFVEKLMYRPGIILDSIRLEQVRKKEEFQQLTAEKHALEQELAANSRVVEQRQKVQAQIAAYQKLAPEIFKVKLQVANQSTGKLTLRSGHFDLTGDQALVNDGLLYQEGAYLQWTDPTTWSQPRSFNSGTWQVKGELTLLGNAAKDVGKLKVDDSLHVDVPAMGSRVLRGQIETTDFSASGGIELFGSLVTHRSTQLQGLTITADAVADLKGLKLTGGEISNLGKLRVIGVDPASGVIKLTNSGPAMIDDQQTLPRLDARSPENLARVATGARPVTWDLGNYDYEFSDYSQITHKRAGSKYLRLCKALMAKEQYVVGHYQIEQEFASSNGLSLKQLATRHKRAFIKLYESEVAKSQTEGSAAEQAELQQYLKQFEPAYQQILASRTAYAKSQHPAAGSALVVESDQTPAVKLQLLNQTPGQLTLKSGKFEFVGDTALVNDGILIQHNAYTLWLTKTPGAFNRGVWRAKGSLGLLGHNGNDMGDLQVEDTLHVNATCDALIALGALAKVKTRRVTLQAPHLQELPETPVRASRTYHWPLEILLSGDFGGNVDISAPVLKISSRIFQTSGNIYAHSGVFDLSAEYGVKAIHAFLGGRDGITVRSKTLDILANKVATGAAVPNILYKRPELGLYSEAGPVVVNVAELITCHYGDIKGTYFTITAPQLINTAGLICATEPGLKSVLNVKSVKHVRDDQASYTSYSYQYGVTYNADGKDWCYCCGGRPFRCGNGCRRQIANTNYYETSGEAILFAQGDLDVTYETLEMLVSSITSLGTLKLVSKGASLDVPNLAVGAELPALPGTTTMTKRNGHVNRLVAKKGLLADVGTADMAADMRGENIHIKAALLTLRSLGIAPQQQAQFIDLFTQESGSSALQMVGFGDGHSGRYVDTVLPLRHKAIPDSLVVLGPDAARQMHSRAILDTQMSMRAMEEIMGSQIYTLIRGVSGLGLSVPDFFKATSSFVRGHKDTVSQRRLIKAGEDQQEVEVQFNATLTPKDLVASGLPAVFMQFSETINTLEAEQDALAAVKSKPRVMMGIPAADVERGIIAEKTVVLESATDLSVATSVKAKDLVAIVAQGTTTVASDVIHHQSGENYTQTLDRTTVAADKVLIQGHDVHLKAIDTHSTQRTDIVATGGSVVDEAVPLVSYRVDRYHSKDESTTVRTTHVHQTTSSHRSDGIAAIAAPVGILQQGTHLANARLEAPVVIQDAVHDQHIVDIETIRHKKAGGIFGSWFGITERKTTHSSSAASIARGAINAGREFIANATTRFRAVAPSFTAERSDITAPQIEITTGVSQHQSFTQSTYQGPVWNKSSVSTEKHTTHCNPTFEHNVYLHSPSVILERVSGSVGTFDKIISDTPVQFRDVDDQHHSTHQSQKSLSAGATLILSLAVTLATANPAAAASIEGAMLSAAYGTLCSQTAICLVEKDGNLGKAIDELGRRDIGKTMLISAASAGLTKGLGDKLGITGSTAFDNLAKKHLLQSAINTTLSVAIDGQRPEDAIKQGLTSAAINTLAAYAADKIGGAYFDKDIDPFSHKLLHGVLGAASGATSAMILGGDIGRGAMSGAFGAVLAETITDAFSPDQADVDSYVAEHPDANKEAIKTHFMEKTQATANWSVFTSTLGAFGVGLDASVAHSTARNAVDHNSAPHIFAWLAISTAVSVEWFHFTKDIEAEGIEAALGKLGIRVIEDATIGMAVASGVAAAPIAFEVAGVACKTLKEAIALVRAHPLITKEMTETCQALEHNMPKLQKMLDGLKVGADKTREYVRDQFNYREHFAAERLRLEGIKPSSGKTSVDGQLLQEHHIISDKSSFTKDHDLIKLAGFDLESGANKMLLPTLSGAEVSTTVRSIHDGRHLEAVSIELSKKMTAVKDIGASMGWTQPEYHAALMEIISAERQMLKSGDRILNKHHRLFATDGGRVQLKIGGVTE